MIIAYIDVSLTTPWTRSTFLNYIVASNTYSTFLWTTRNLNTSLSTSVFAFSSNLSVTISGACQMSGVQISRLRQGLYRRVFKRLVLKFLIALLLFTCAWHYVNNDMRFGKENTGSNMKVSPHKSQHAQTKACVYVCMRAHTLDFTQ